MRKQIDRALSIEEDNRLHVEGVAVSDLAEKFGTPLYVISENQLRENARAFQSAFGDLWSEGQVCVMPAIKANYNLALRCILTEEGCGCDLFSEGELWAALKGGVEPSKMSLNGNSKIGFGDSILKTAIAAGVKITLDDAAEFVPVERVAKALGKKANVRIRLRPEYPALNKSTDFVPETIPTELATQVYKSGMPMEDVIPLGKKILASEHATLTGIHIHQGRHSRELAFWKGTMEGFAVALGQLKKAWGGWEPTDIDLGGGFPPPRDPLGREIDRSAWFTTGLMSAGVKLGGLFNARNQVTQGFLNMAHADKDKIGPDPFADLAPSIEEYAQVVTETLRKELKKNGVNPQGKNLEIEPGRGLYGNAGIHVTKVTFIKRQTSPLKLTWVNTDTSDAFLNDGVAEHSRFRYMLADKPLEGLKDEEVMTADIVGCSCNGDRIIGDARVPKNVDGGDVLAFLDTGAYQDSSANNFNAMPRPATVLVNGDSAEVIKRRETYEDVFQRDQIPDRFQIESHKLREVGS
jgi:diaminopimelate decarboxylase